MSTLPSVNTRDWRGLSALAGGTQLSRRLARELATEGPVTFRAFMERALYEPELGYYRRPRSPWGAPGDYVTAPRVHRAVGMAIARLVGEVDRALGEPPRLDVVEVGGGDGRLLFDFCQEVRRRAPDLYGRLRVWSVERSEYSLAAQRRRLAQHAAIIHWRDGLDALPDNLTGLVFSNELIDALPVHRVVRRDGELLELHVDLDGDRFVESPASLSTPRLREYFDFNGVKLAEGQVAEICLAADRYLATVAGRLQRGYLLTIDYGAGSRVLFDPELRWRGSLVCQRRFRLSANPYARVGDQDITAHVDFGNLRRRGERLGLETAGESSLAVFLLGFGAAAGAGLAATADAAARRDHLGLRHLLFSEIGEAHRVLLQTKRTVPILFGRDRLATPPPR